MLTHDSEKPVGSVFFVNGQLVLKALPGFEHFFPPGFEASFQGRPPSPSLSPSPTVQSEIKPEAKSPTKYEAKSELKSPTKTEAGTAFMKGTGWTTVKKRECPEPAALEPPPKRPRPEKKMASHEFRIGDVDGMKKFYYIRLGEVGINALRRIITEWVKVLEPTRLRNYGPYHKLKQYSWDFKLLDNKPVPNDRGPPWWPNDVPYVEPAHLPSKCLEALGVAIMFLQFSTAEQDKEYHAGEGLISKLHNAAKYFISTLPAQEYAMGHDAWNAVMKERALQSILPELLQVSRQYEEHIIQEGKEEGERAPSPALGKLFKYAELQKPVRKSWKGKKAEEDEAKEVNKVVKKVKGKGQTPLERREREMMGLRPVKPKVSKVMAVNDLLNT
ncbi:hypothetical protein CC80DRAFT_294394 [Byssothecium circinans]|uniref:Subtelomeric hrmA-associated cluster protein AFUB-079030/YDR124W-like helical bundle domain-containing protein n=1 Tax=Byssothecium circinans TaxID=147558 RepID=A0A6A5U6Z1_9PLEO|nr:hypothetical protein CC80DRAFT_294394 [Byssothecium circinans]